MKRLKIWIQALRLPFLTGSVLPVILGTCIAYAHNNTFHPLLFLITLLAVIFLHLGANLINDFFDHKTGADAANQEFSRPFTGGSRVIQNKLLTPHQILRAAVICFSLAALAGFYLFLKTNTFILILGGIGLVSAIFYVTPRFSWINLGIGELIIALNFGILPTLGSYFVQTGTWNWLPIFASAPLAILIAAILFINEFQDFNGDKASHKQTIVVRLGRKRSAAILAFFLVGAFIGQIFLTFLDKLSNMALLPLFSIPFLFTAIYFLLRFYENPRRLVPANISIILLHSFFALFLILSFLKNSLSDNLFTILFALIFLTEIILFPGIFQVSKKAKLSEGK